MVEKNISFNLAPEELAEFRAYMMRVASDVPNIKDQLDEFERQIKLAGHEATNFAALSDITPSMNDVPISGNLTELLLALEAYKKESDPSR